MGSVRRMAKRAAISAGQRFVERHVIGERRPVRSLRGAQPHERLDALRPEVPWLQAWVIRPGLLFAAGFGAWIVQSIATGSTGWGWGIAVLMAALLFHRTVFRWWLIAKNEPYTHNFMFPTLKLFAGAFRVLGPSRIALISLAVTVVFDLFNRLAGSSPTSFFAIVANLFFVVALGALVHSALKLGHTYRERINAQYEMLWAYKVERIDDLPDDHESGLPLKVAHLDQTFVLADLPNLQQYAASLGYTITDYDIVGRVRTAELTPVSPIEVKIYEHAARNIGKPVYDFTFRFEWVDNDEPDRDVHPQRIETLMIERAPIAGLTPEKRETFLLALRDSLPKGSNGWKITDKQDDPVKVLQYGKPLALPTLVPMRDLLVGIDHSDWNRIDIGIDQDGHPRGIDLKDGPHSLVIGPTGSGKTIVLRMIATQALARGHEVIVLDPMKAAVDFARLRDRLKMTVISEIDAGTQIKRIYDEVVRRKQVLIEHDRAFWADLDAEVREREQIRPLTVIIDEYTSLILPIALDKNMTKMIEPEEIEQTELINAAKATLKFYAGKIAREARFVGVHLAIATQRPDAQILGGEFRAQLASGVLAVKPKSPPESTTLHMAFPSVDSASASQIVNALDNGSRGLALIGAEGGEVRGIKIGYALEDDIPALLDELKIPLGNPEFPVSAVSPGQPKDAGEELPSDDEVVDAAPEPAKPTRSIFDPDVWGDASASI